MTHFRPKSATPMQYLKTALAKNLRTGIAEQSFGCAVPGQYLALFVHAEGSIGGRLHEIKKFMFQHRPGS
jgi:hypothetical protein